MNRSKKAAMPAEALKLERDLDAIMRASRVIAGVVAESIAQAGDVTAPQFRTLVLVATRSGVNASAVAAAPGSTPPTPPECSTDSSRRDCSTVATPPPTGETSSYA